MPPPTNTKGLRRFLGLCNYIRDCIPSMPAKTEVKLSVLYLRNKYDQTVYWRVRNIKISSKCPNAVLCHPNWESSCRTANIARQMCSTDEPVTGCKEYLSLGNLFGFCRRLSDNDYTVHTCMEIQLFHMDAMPVEIS